MNLFKYFSAEVRKRKPKRVLIQLPEGLKTRAIEIVKRMQDAGIETILSGDSCYGACDLRINEAELIDADLIVHVGHKDFGVKSKVPVLYYPWETPVTLPLKKLDAISEKTISVLTTVQYEKQLPEIKDYLENNGKKVVFTGTTLGCKRPKLPESDCVLFVGTGRFHALGIEAEKVYLLDLEKGLTAISEDIKKQKMKRAARLAKLEDAKIVGLVMSSKPGQFQRTNLKIKDKKVVKILMDEITSEKLEGIKVDLFVNTACP
ncbi:MAG: diphthamide synthesis protein, partial [Candidatus Hodarchaeales archaeon]